MSDIRKWRELISPMQWRVLFLVAALAALVVAGNLAGCTQIDTGNVGIESTFGQVKEQSLTPGVYNTVFKRVLEVSAKEIPIEVANLTPKAKDNVTLQDVDLTVYYKIDPARAPAIFTRYSGDVSTLKDSGDVALASGLVARMAREATYKAFAAVLASEAHTKRTDIAADIRSATQAEIDADAGKGWIQVTNIIVRNIVTDPRLEESIKQAAAVEFQIREKNQQISLAKSEAERKRIEAEGEARANKIIADSLSPALIQLRQIEATAMFAKNGTHTVLLPQGAQPLIQVK